MKAVGKVMRNRDPEAGAEAIVPNFHNLAPIPFLG